MLMGSGTQAMQNHDFQNSTAQTSQAGRLGRFGSLGLTSILAAIQKSMWQDFKTHDFALLISMD